MRFRYLQLVFSPVTFSFICGLVAEQVGLMSQICLNKHAVKTHHIKTSRNNTQLPRDVSVWHFQSNYTREMSLFETVSGPSSAHWPDVSWVIDGSLSWSQGIWWSDAGLGSVCHDVLSVEIHLGRIRDFCTVWKARWWWRHRNDGEILLDKFIVPPEWHSCVSRSDFPLRQAEWIVCSSQNVHSGGVR